ncbi:MAG: hypothetical protein HYW34_00730 [Candidatus Brennerbacteria bacterium]|nr:hypothetical protein [Candidatus Brennerbacteria bacterium]
MPTRLNRIEQKSSDLETKRANYYRELTKKLVGAPGNPSGLKNFFGGTRRPQKD